MTTPADNFKEFYECVGTNYPEEDLVYETLRGVVRKQFVSEFVSNFSGTFLDLGCNRGSYLTDYTAGTGIGVDISLPVLRIAKQRNRAHYLQGDAQQLSFIKSGSIDCILCSEMIEHVLQPEHVIAECYRILRPGGRLLLTTPNYRRKRPTWVSIGEMQNFGVSGVDGNAYFHTAFRPEELAQMAEKSGFSSINSGTFEKEVKYATRLPVTIYYLIAFLNKVVIRNTSVARINSRMLNTFSLQIYRICVKLRINNLFCKLVKEGVRTFLLAKK